METHLAKKEAPKSIKSGPVVKHLKKLTRRTPPKKDHSGTMDPRKDVHNVPKTARTDMKVNKEMHHRNQKQMRDLDSESDDEGQKALKK